MVCRVRVGLEWEEEEWRSYTVLLRPPGMGGLSIFFCYVDLDQASSVNPKNIRSIWHTQKNNWKLAAPKNIPMLYLDLKKNP